MISYLIIDFKNTILQVAIKWLVMLIKDIDAYKLKLTPLSFLKINLIDFLLVKIRIGIFDSIVFPSSCQGFIWAPSISDIVKFNPHFVQIPFCFSYTFCFMMSRTVLISNALLSFVYFISQKKLAIHRSYPAQKVFHPLRK